MSFLKPYFDTEGPCGLPMKDRQAKSLELRLRELPKEDAFGLRRCAFERGITEVAPEGRCEVSWITEETPDRAGDVVLARGMDDSHFQLNPIVTLNHAYDQPPVGRSLWRKRVREGSLVGVKAKTFYPPRPETWTSGDWPPDHAFELIKAGLLRGKSIGFFPLKLRAPTSEEVERLPEYAKVRYIIEEWLLAEYACCVLPMQPHAVVEQLCKSQSSPLAPREASGGVPFATPHDLERELPHLLQSAAFTKSLEAALERSWQMLRGRV